MTAFEPVELAAWTGGSWLGGLHPEGVAGFCFDTRQIQPGECFIALTPGQRDGHDFVAQALREGASAALVERELDLEIPQLVVSDTLLAMEAIGSAVRCHFKGRVIGVTGSCGKTSTKEMLRHLLGPDATHATRGNWNNRIGVPMTLLGLHQSGKSAAVVEAGINQPGEMSHLGGMIQADLVVVTNIGPAHLEKLGSLQGVAREKSLLMEHARENAGLILPASAFRHEAFSRFADRAVVLAQDGETVEGNPRTILRYQTEAGEIRIEELFGETTFTVASHSPGIHANAVLALVAAHRSGIPGEQLKERLAAWNPGENRGLLVERDGRPCYLDCYNANPASMADALSAFAISVPRHEPRCYVLGAMRELGPDAVDLHTESVRGLKLRPGDIACLVGPEEFRAAYRRGMESAPEQVHEAASAAELQSIIASFHGALFLKGSRSFALEQLLSEPPE